MNKPVNKVNYARQRKTNTVYCGGLKKKKKKVGFVEVESITVLVRGWESCESKRGWLMRAVVSPAWTNLVFSSTVG